LRFGLITSTDAADSYGGGGAVVGGIFGAFCFGFRFGSLRGRSLPFAIARSSERFSGPVELRRSCATGPY
jgi:hypothetical protein